MWGVTMGKRVRPSQPAPGGRPAKASTPAPERASVWRRVRVRHPAFLACLLSVCAVAAAEWPLLHKLGVRTCAFADWAGFCEAALSPLPGGALHWLAGLLSAFWALPVLGLTLFLLLGLGVTALGRRWARLPLWAAPLPFAVVVWQVAYCGFSVWLFADASFPMLYLLAWAVLLSLSGSVARFGGWAAFLLPVLYPLCGTPTLMGGVVAATLPNQTRRTRVLLLAISALLPCLWQWGSLADPAWDTLLIANVPILVEKGAFFWDTATLLLFLALTLAPWQSRIRLPKFPCRPKLPRPIASLLRGAAPTVVFGIAIFCAMDPIHPLMDVLACERALERGDMARILAVPDERVVNHRMLAAYRIHALWRTGQLEERLFDLPWKVSHNATTIDTMELDGYTLLYHYGIVQLARRWCYESVVNKGWSAPKLALLARTALVCGESALARRYALQLRRIPLRRSEGDTLLALSRGEGRPDSELLRVANLHRRLCLDSGSPIFEGDKRLEPGIYNRYAVLKNGDRDMVALYLCASLLRKDLTPLIENYDVILRVWPQRPLPRAFQQGLLAAASTLPPAEQPRLTADLFSPGMPQAFADFQRLSQNRSAPSDPAFRNRFAKTFWFYAAFVP